MRVGTDMSVSCVRDLISSKIFSRKGARCAVCFSVHAFSASRWAMTSRFSLSRSHSYSSTNVCP